ncbi:unnamed protein product [Urochloa humidicola]
MSFRRFLYLVADDCVDLSYSLRRIDMSRFFFRAPSEGAPTPLDSSGGAGATDPLAMEDSGSLPDPTLSLRMPQDLEQGSASINFMLYKNKGRDGDNLKVVTIDHMGRALMCDPSLPPTFLTLPMTTPKFAPFSVTVGSSLYVMDVIPKQLHNGSEQHSFELMSYDRNHLKAWYWHSLPPPPCAYGRSDLSDHIESYAVVAGTDILVSNKAKFAKNTYRFDTVKSTWRKAGDWVMPFSHLAEYIPEHKLWFGLSSMGDGYRFLAANLMPPSNSEEMSPPVVCDSWKEYVQPPPEWSLVRSYAVHLGSSKFCIIRLFEIGERHVCPETHKTYTVAEELQVVLTGVEVESRGEKIQVVKHKSERYKLDIESEYWIL